MSLVRTKSRLCPLLALGALCLPTSRAICADPQPGFPVTAEALQPLLVDLDGNGSHEVVLGVGGVPGYLVLDGGGAPLPGWPVLPTWPTSPSTPLYPVSQTMAGDVDGDGVPEFVYAANSGTACKVIVVLNALGQQVPGSPIQACPYGSMQHDEICLADLDGDGDLEIVWPTRGDVADRQVYAFQGDGTPVAGWPTPIPIPVGYETFNHGLTGLAAGDRDGDGKDEVLVTYGSGLPATGPAPSPMFIFDDDGTHLDTWFCPEPAIFRMPMIVDIDLDGSMETIVVGTNRIYWFDATGGQFAPQNNIWTVWRPYACADVDGNGDRELVIGGESVRVIDPVGGVTAEFLDPQYDIYTAPSIGDIDGDGEQEVVFWARNQQPAPLADVLHLYVTDSLLVAEAGWPVELTSSAFAGESVSLGDLDGDGDIEVISDQGSAFLLHAWQIPNPAGEPVSVAWSGLGGDPTNSRWVDRGFVAPDRFVRGDADRSGSVGIGDVISSLGYMFAGLPSECPAALDIDANQLLQINDPLLVLSYLFQMGPPPATPGWPECEPSPPGQLDCEWRVCP